MVAGLCDALEISHATLEAQWASKPETAVQERARTERYRLLSAWATERDLSAIATAHHLDDQAETLVMRLNRGGGVRGLAGIRPVSVTPGRQLPLLHPLLRWRRSELEQLCRSADVDPAQDPSNLDEQFERVRVRRGLAEASWLDVEAIAASAANLAYADEAVEWATDLEWASQVRIGNGEIVYRPLGPGEIRRRIACRAVASLASEGEANPLRGRELDRLVETLSKRGSATLRGVLCAAADDDWRFTPAPPRKR